MEIGPDEPGYGVAGVREEHADQAYAQIGDRLNAILRAAEEAASEMRRRAEEEAERLRTEASEAAAAERERAEVAAREVVSAAERRARKLEAEAQRRRDALAAEADAVQERLHRLVGELRTLDDHLSVLLSTPEAGAGSSPPEVEPTPQATEDVQAPVAERPRAGVEPPDGQSEEP